MERVVPLCDAEQRRPTDEHSEVAAAAIMLTSLNKSGSILRVRRGMGFDYVPERV